LAKEELAKRKKREVLAPDGKLVILAADHPARSVTRVGQHATAMGHRLDYWAGSFVSWRPATSTG